MAGPGKVPTGPAARFFAGGVVRVTQTNLVNARGTQSITARICPRLAGQEKANQRPAQSLDAS